jgi:hypothetical protein
VKNETSFDIKIKRLLNKTVMANKINESKDRGSEQPAQKATPSKEVVDQSKALR